MGLLGMFFARIHYADRSKRQRAKEMEMEWNCSPNQLLERKLFTSVFYNHYTPPSGFDFGGGVGSLQIEQHTDFKVNVMYSTPACYLKALLESGVPFPKKVDDFFPYEMEANSYWSGYFTSRPTFKWLARYANNLLQVCQAIELASNGEMKHEEDVATLRRALAIVQHHDAITGTSTQAVTENYYSMLIEGIEKCQDVLNNAWMETAASTFIHEPVPYQTFCNLINCSVCRVSQESSKVHE
ncbi:unnamed protein product [Soboliphyme baturini]|uniref:Alpha-mann_mid domain-containing protein n=1 Tax=Soboliphyme baturini TaxID=241478 RepID=A0A183IVR9_9BILA|nr:unnamed protein product [Soboliphyme baturini]